MAVRGILYIGRLRKSNAPYVGNMKGQPDMIDITEYEAMMMFDLADDERAKLSRRLNGLADGFKALEYIDAGGAEPLVTVLDLHNILREDVSGKLVDRDELLSNAPEHSDGYFKVPGTLE